jgi:hypothetical protein
MDAPLSIFLKLLNPSMPRLPGTTSRETAEQLGR